MLIRPTKQGLPDEQVHLLVARNVLDETEVKFFLSNAPEKDAGDYAAHGRFLAMACRALLPGSETRYRPRCMGRTTLPGTETSFNLVQHQLPVPGSDANETEGKKIQN